MKIAVVGAGGIGGYYGALLHQGGHEVTFLARGSHLAAIRERGLRVESVLLPEPVSLRVRVTERSEEIGPVDLVLFGVKSYDTDTAAAVLPALIADKTAVLTLQNGVDNVDRLGERVGRAHVLGGAAYIFTAIASPGIISHTGGSRRVVLGELDGEVTTRGQAIRDAFAATGVPVDLSPQILVAMWEKYLFITAQGGMTALTRLPIGPIRQSPATMEMYLDVASEVASVGRAHARASSGQLRGWVLRATHRCTRILFTAAGWNWTPCRGTPSAWVRATGSPLRSAGPSMLPCCPMMRRLGGARRCCPAPAPSSPLHPEPGGQLLVGGVRTFPARGARHQLAEDWRTVPTDLFVRAPGPACLRRSSLWN